MRRSRIQTNLLWLADKLVINTGVTVDVGCVLLGFVATVAVPQHLPGLSQDFLDEDWVQFSTSWLNFRWLCIFLLVGVHLRAGQVQVGQQAGGGGGGVQPVEPRQFIFQKMSN